MRMNNKSSRKQGLDRSDPLSLWLVLLFGIVLFLTVSVRKSAAQVVVADGFNISSFSTVFQPSGLAFAPEGSVYGPDLFSGSWGEAPPDTQRMNDKIFTISASGAPTLFTSLLPEADPVSLVFPAIGSDFVNSLYVSSNNRDGGTSGDCGGTIQTVDLAGNVLDFTSLTAPFNCPSGVSTALEEPGGITFGRGDAFGSDLFVANFSERPSDIVRVDPNGNTTPFVNDGKFSRRSDFGLSPLDVAFGPGGDFGTDLYFNDNGELCSCVRIADATGSFSAPFISLPGLPVSLKFGTGGPFGNDLYVAVLASGGSSIFRVKPDGSASLFATGFTGLLSVGTFEFSPDGTAMYVADTSGNTIYRIDVGFTNVRVIDTISRGGIDLDQVSISPPPFSITPESNQTQIEWRFDTFAIGQIEDLIFDVVLKNPNAGEDRLVSHKVEVLYTDINGNPIRIELPAKFVHVLSSAVSSVLSTDKSEYTANEDVFINLSISNLSSFARTIDVVIDIEDKQGNLVQALTTFNTLPFAAGGTTDFLPLVFNTGTIFDGDYRVHLHMIEAGVQVDEAIANFTILPVSQADSSMVPDKMAYVSNELVTLTATLASQSPNSVLSELEASLTINDPGGLLLYSETKMLSDLLPEARMTFDTFFNTATHPAGLYSATVQFNSNGNGLTSSSTTFEVLSSLDSGLSLSGTLDVLLKPIEQNQSTTMAFTLQNVGNVATLPLVDITILVVDPDTGIALDTLTDNTVLNGQLVYANNLLFDSSGLSPKTYLIVLQGTVGGKTQPLDSTGLEILVPENMPPVADANFTFVQNSCLSTTCDVSLDGSASTDPDSAPGTEDDIVSYEWYEDYGTAQETELLPVSRPQDLSSPLSTVALPLGSHEITLVVTDTAGQTSTDTILITLDAAALALLQLEEVEVKWDKNELEIEGKVALPIGLSPADLTASASVSVTLSTLGNNPVINQSVSFTVEGSTEQEWEFEDETVALGITEFEIDWEGAKFDYNRFIRIESDRIGQTTTSLEIERKDIVGAFSIEVGGVTIDISADNTVTSTLPGMEIDVDEDEIELELPFALTPQMVMTISGWNVADTVVVGDYLTNGIGKFEIEALFNFDATIDINMLNPTFDLNLSLGAENFAGSFSLGPLDWEKLDPDEWEYEDE